MVKDAEKTNDDVIAKLKAEQTAKDAAKVEQAEKERIAKEQESLDPGANEKPANAELAKAAADVSDKIEKSERNDSDIPVSDDDDVQMDRDNRSAARYAKSRAAGEKLKLIAMSYPQTTPNEHIIFGAGGYKYTLGDLRNLVGIA